MLDPNKTCARCQAREIFASAPFVGQYCQPCHFLVKQREERIPWTLIDELGDAEFLAAVKAMNVRKIRNLASDSVEIAKGESVFSYDTGGGQRVIRSTRNLA